MPIRISFAQLCRDTRIRLLELVERIATALELEVELVSRMPVVIGSHQRDLVHARCSSHVDGRLRKAGWLTAGEVEIVHGRSHGWIDLLALDPKTGILLAIEVKTRLDDLGAVERQLGWYERSSFEVARGLGWQPRRVVGWLLLLATDEVEGNLRTNRELMANSFPIRAREMLGVLNGIDEAIRGRGVALIDPRSKRRAWLIPSRVDGRRSSAPYVGYADAARQMAA